MKNTFFLSFLFSFFSIVAQPTLDVDLYATPFSRPVDIDHAFDDRLFIVEQIGRIKIINGTGNILPNPFLDIQARVNDAGNEQGLLGLAFPPDYATSGVFYVNYTGGSGNGFTNISRFKRDPGNPNLALPNSEEVILTFPQPFANHNGGDLNFGADGYLYIAVGDGGSAGDPGDRAQNKNSFFGKILRLDVDTIASYKIPADNPFVGQANVKEEIWSYGLRNPWRFSFDRETGDMWIGDVGQGAKEEVDFESAASAGGVNYGWRCWEANQAFNNTNCNGNYTFPIFNYPHNNATGGFSISGGYVYRGMEYPEINGTYICADYLSGNFWTISPNDETGDWMNFRQDDLLFDVSCFGENQNGELYVAALSGSIYKISGDCPDSTIDFTISEQNDTLFADIIANDFQWFLNGNVVDGATNDYLVPQSSGNYQCKAKVNISGCHYDAISNLLNYVECNDTLLIVELTLENDTLRSSILNGSYTWYFNGEVIPETQSFHVPLEVGDYYVEVTLEDECTFFGISNVVTTECTLIECIATIAFLNDTIFSSCVSGQITWWIDGVPIDSLGDESEFIIPIVSGEYQLTVYDSIAPYCVRKDTSNVLTIVINGVLTQSAKQLKVFPNPATDMIKTSIGLELIKQTDKVVIYNYKGEKQNASYKIEKGDVYFDLSKLTIGSYIIDIRTEETQYIGKFIKQ